MITNKDYENARNINVKEVLEQYGNKAYNKAFYICPFHSDTHPSATIHLNKLKCHSCGAYKSTIDIVMEYEKCDSFTAIRKLCNSTLSNNIQIEPGKEKNNSRGENTSYSYMCTKINKVAKQNNNKFIDSYLAKRKLTGFIELLSKFAIEVNHNYYKDINYIIYHFKTNKYLIQKSLDSKIKRNIGSPTFEILEHCTSSQNYYICEGIEDSLSLLFLVQNINVICLNSIVNADKLERYMLDNMDWCKDKTFIFALDYDNGGINTGKKLKEFFIKHNLKYDYYKDFYSYAIKNKGKIKDINDFYIAKGKKEY